MDGALSVADLKDGCLLLPVFPDMTDTGRTGSTGATGIGDCALAGARLRMEAALDCGFPGEVAVP